MAGGGQADFTDNPAELLQASPSIVLADPGPHADTGRVLSVAPLMGATASIDSSHVRWLHVKVRPPARGLLKAARVTLCFPPHEVHFSAPFATSLHVCSREVGTLADPSTSINSKPVSCTQPWSSGGSTCKHPNCILNSLIVWHSWHQLVLLDTAIAL